MLPIDRIATRLYNRGMNATNDIERQLRAAIESSGKSLNQLGLAAGVNDGQLSRFMRGERTLTLETVARLCRVLGLRLYPTDEPTDAATPPKTAKADAPPSGSKRSAASEGKSAGKRRKRK